MHSLVEYFSGVKMDWLIIRKNMISAFGYYFWYWLVRIFTNMVIKFYKEEVNTKRKYIHEFVSIAGNLFFLTVFALIYVYTAFEKPDYNLLVTLLSVAYLYTFYGFFKLLNEDLRYKVIAIVVGLLLFIFIVLMGVSFFYEFWNNWIVLSCFALSALVMIFILWKRK